MLTKLVKPPFFENPPDQAIAVLARLAAPHASWRSDKLPVCKAPADLAHWLRFHGLHALCHHYRAADARVLEYLTPHVALSVAAEELQRNELNSLLTQLSARNLPAPIIIKGSALAYSVYERPWLRPRTDHDVLICKLNYGVFNQALLELGYAQANAISGSLVSYQSSYGKALAAAAFNLDLHWRVSNRQLLANSLSYKELSGSAQRIKLFDSTVIAKQAKPSVAANTATAAADALVPSSVNALMLAAIHSIGHHQGDERLIWYYDALLLYKALSTEEKALLIESVRGKKISHLMLYMLQRAEALFQTTLLSNPERAAFNQLLTQPEPNRALLGLRKGDEQHPLGAQPTQALSRSRLFLLDLKGLPSITAKLKFVLENVCPTGNYMRVRFNTQSVLLAHLKRLRRVFS